MYKLLKPLLFLSSAEKAHYRTMDFFKLVLKIPGVSKIIKKIFSSENTKLQKEVMGLKFKNPIGLAAGFDKNGAYIDELNTLGFGFIEVGTVTPRPQPGNPQPRLFRLPQDHALINRMGFNNMGVDVLVGNLINAQKENVIIGGNIGKNKDTPNDRAFEDYLICFKRLFEEVDYFVVNVSSPNTPCLRSLQEKEPLSRLLLELQKVNQAKDTPKPILLKIAPDLNHSQLDDILDIVKQTKIEGLIATNTTISREGLKETNEKIAAIGNGGLSGNPVKHRATEIIRYLRTNGHKELVIIGVGGVESAEDAQEKLAAGADLVQIFTGMIYEGPAIVKNILKGLTSVAENRQQSLPASHSGGPARMTASSGRAGLPE